VAGYMKTMTREKLETLAKERDIPLHTLAE